MFEHTQRTNFLDLLRPPSGYRLESAVGTTYSLDFVALTATLLALIDAEGEIEQGSVKQIDSLHAITRLADRVRVFVNRGQISGPSQVSRVTTLYDRIIREVRLPEGCFHPKVWIAHYRPRKSLGGEALPGVVRVICASRNLTTSQCWEAFVGCEGREGTRKAESKFNSDVVEFLNRLIDSELQPSLNVLWLRDALRHTTFDLLRPLEKEARFLWQWQGYQSLDRHLPLHGRRAMVVSPFVRKAFLHKILSRFDKVIVISCQHEFDKISDDSFMSKLCGGSNRVYTVQPAETEEGGAMELHAKLLVFEDEHGSQTFLGSANASGSGWEGRNCEAVVKFAPGVSIDHFCDRFVFSDESPKRGGRRPLRGWITEYKRGPFVEDEDDRAEKFLDEVCVALAQLELRAIYAPDSQYLHLTLETVSPQLSSDFCNWTSACNLQIALLSQLRSDTALKPLCGLLEDGVSFNDVGLSDLTEFLVIDVRHRKQDIHKRFVLKANADFAEWCEQRDAALLQQLLTRDSLQAFLEAILFDAAARPPEQTVDGKWKPRSGVATTPFLLSELTVEDVLRSCTEDTSRIEEINQVLKAFEKTQWIDQEFRNFWATFLEAERKARRGAGHG